MGGLRSRLLGRPHRCRRARGARPGGQRPERLPDLRDPGRAHAGAGPARAARAARRGLRTPAGGPAGARAGRLPGAWHTHRQQLRCGESRRRGALHPAAGAAPGPARAAHRRGAWRRCQRPGVPRGAAGRAGRGVSRGFAGQCQRLHRRARDCRGPAGRRRDRGGRPRVRPLADPGAGHGAFRLGLGRLGPPGARHHGRPPAGMRRPGHGRLLRRPGLQGRAGPGAAGLSHRHHRALGRLHHHQARRHGRPGQRTHGQGTAAVRGARPGRLPDARRGGRPVRGRGAPGGA